MGGGLGATTLYGLRKGNKMIYRFANLLVLIFFVLSSQIIFSQWKVGLQGGVNISTYDLKNKAEFAEISSKTGLVIGGIVVYSIDDQLEINSGLRYIIKGAHIVIDEVGFQLDNKLNFNFLEIPLHLKYLFVNSSFKPFISAGIDLSYLALAKGEGTVDGNPIEDDITEQLDKFELSLDGGLGLEYEADNNISYILSSNYSYSLVKVDQDLTNRGLQILFSVLYTF